MSLKKIPNNWCRREELKRKIYLKWKKSKHILIQEISFSILLH